MKRIRFAEGEYYHIYNRGVDKRNIYEDSKDFWRFIYTVKEFNTTDPIGGLNREPKTQSKTRGSTSQMVKFVAYCLNQNHYHFMVTPLAENGIQKLMHRISTGYTMYFNDKHKRSGTLFQGRYKAVHIETNKYLLHLSAYVNLNDKVHKNLNKEWLTKLPFSSLSQYITDGRKEGIICGTSIILKQYKSKKDYLRYINTTLPIILKRKENEKELARAMLEN